MKVSVLGTKMQIQFGAVVIVGLCLVGLVFFGYSYHEQTNLIENAEQIQGTVLNVDDEIEKSSGRGGTSYSISVEYEYEFNGSIYTNDDVFPGSFIGGSTRNKSEARAILASLEEGNTTTVYVDPANPKTAFLVDRRTGQHTFYMAAMVAFIFGTIIFSILKSRWEGHTD